MKKNLLMASMMSLAVSGLSVRAQSWQVVSIKQGPARGYVAGNLKPGGVAKPLRDLIPSCTGVPCWPQPGSVNGYPIPPRSVPGNALVAENADVSGNINYISLGLGGQIIMRYSHWIANGPGADFTIYETSPGNPACNPATSEQAFVEVSEDGVNWLPGNSGSLLNGSAGTYNVCYNGSIDITPFVKIQYIRITDRTNPDSKIKGEDDGYDLDGIGANYPLPPGLGTTPNSNCGYQQGVASQFVGQSGNFPGRGIVGQRKDFSKANINESGFPSTAFMNPGIRDSGPASGSYNFWSIGFGGWACFQLPYTVFNGPGDDIYAFETTWNNMPCPNYNEKARVSVSLDGNNWSQPVTICKDALSIPGTSPAIDLAAFGPSYSVINYIRFEDASNTADFGGGADGYDIDNIALAQFPPVNPGTPNPNFSNANGLGNRQEFRFGVASFMEGGVPEEMFPLEIIGSNVVGEKIEFRATIADESNYKYSIRSSTGQEVLNGDFNGDLFSTPVTEVSVSKLNKGVYFLTLISSGSRETVKFVKQ